MRTLALACCTCLACTRLNPAFDQDSQVGEDSTETRADTSEDPSDDSSDDSSDADTDATSDTGPDDLPAEPVCEFQPSSGLAIQFGDPSYFGNGCPNSVDVWATIGSAAGGEATLAVCNQGCDGCYGEHLLAAFPLIITDHLPPVGSCVNVQATIPLAQQSSSCLWGALSIHSPTNGTPYVIATAHSAAPTPYGADVLAGLIPQPVKAASCNCDAIGHGNDCCYQAGGPPEFWYYPFQSADVYPGDFTPVQIGNLEADHYFELYQAERIYSCEHQDLQLSWAVVAKF